MRSKSAVSFFGAALLAALALAGFLGCKEAAPTAPRLPDPVATPAPTPAPGTLFETVGTGFTVTDPVVQKMDGDMLAVVVITITTTTGRGPYFAEVLCPSMNGPGRASVAEFYQQVPVGSYSFHIPRERSGHQINDLCLGQCGYVSVKSLTSRSAPFVKRICWGA